MSTHYLRVKRISCFIENVSFDLTIVEIRFALVGLLTLDLLILAFFLAAVTVFVKHF